MSNDLTDLLERAGRPVAGVRPPTRDDLVRRRRQSRTRMVAVAASVTAVAAVVGLALGLRPDSARHPDPPAGPTSTGAVTSPAGPVAAPSGPTAAELRRYRWTTLPTAPIPVRSGAAGAWTGRQLLVWGGSGRADGAAYDPAARTWTTLPPAPLSGRTDADAVWTGTRFVVWGGDHHAETLTDGAAYDPVTHRWTVLPPAVDAVPAWSQLVAVDGSAVLLSTSADLRTLTARTWDANTDSWSAPATRQLGEQHAAQDAVALAAGDRVLVWVDWTWSRQVSESYGPSSGSSDTQSYEVSSGADGYAFAPASGSWSVASLSPGAGRMIDAPQWTGSQVLAATTNVACYVCSQPAPEDRVGVRIDSATGRTAVLPHGPVSDLHPTWLFTGRVLLGVDAQAVFGGQHAGAAAFWDETTGLWTRLPAAPFRSTHESVVVWAGDRVLIWGPLHGPVSGTAGQQASGLQLAAP